MEHNQESQERGDHEIIEAVRSGRVADYDELVYRYSSKLFQVAYGLLGNHQDAEEVLQDAFVRAFNGLVKFRGDSSFETWIHRIVINLSRNKYQWNRRRGAEVNISMTYDNPDKDSGSDGEEMAIPDVHLEPDRILEGVELEDRILAGMEQLPDKLKETMVLRHVDDLPYEKIAELLECKVGTVKSRLARGRQIMRELVGIQ